MYLRKPEVGVTVSHVCTIQVSWRSLNQFTASCLKKVLLETPSFFPF